MDIAAARSMLRAAIHPTVYKSDVGKDFRFGIFFVKPGNANESEHRTAFNLYLKRCALARAPMRLRGVCCHVTMQVNTKSGLSLGTRRLKSWPQPIQLIWEILGDIHFLRQFDEGDAHGYVCKDNALIH